MIFNRLTHGEGLWTLSGQRVLDVFAGSGSLGLEALSRGADFVAFIEKNSLTKRKLARFLKTHRLEGQTYLVHASLPYLPACPMQPFNLCFLDAPYGEDLIPTALKNLKEQNWITPGTLFVAETDKQESLPLPSWIRITHKRTKGRTHVYFLTWPAEEPHKAPP